MKKLLQLFCSLIAGIEQSFTGNSDSNTAGPSQAGGPRGHVPPHFLADQLTLSQPGGAHYPHPVVRATPDFQTLRRPWRRFLNEMLSYVLNVHFQQMASSFSIGYFF